MYLHKTKNGHYTPPCCYFSGELEVVEGIRNNGGSYGTTVNSYLISKRITRAKQLLRFTDMTVDEVGAAVGMGDANYFSRMFRKVEGISPREYRKQW